MKVLVLVEDYPSENSHAMMYVHVRNKFYYKKNINVTVLNFSTNNDYEYENIKVISLKTYKEVNEKYDILICHAANLKHHYCFLTKYEKNFEKIVFFYHGHEILKISEVYPPNYKWIKTKNNKFIRDIYDKVKCILWKRKLNKLLYKSQLVFVSRWLYDRFLYYIHMNPKNLEKHVSIINNSVGSIFEEKSYNLETQKKYDFITIRGNAIDRGEKGIDIVTQLAESNPSNTFLVVGKGKFYQYNKKPENLEFLEKQLTHQEMLEYLNKSRCALLPTKQDTQGVMTCEVATYGIPTITSDIEVCKEIFSNMKNVKFINNSETNIKLGKILQELEQELDLDKHERFFAKNTIQKEVDLFNKQMKT